MNNKVTSKQITNAAAVIIMTTSLLTKQLYIFSKNDAWLIVIISFFVCFLIYLIYSAIASKFHGFSLMEINEAIFGRIFGKFISLLYIFFFFTIATLNVNVLGNFAKAFVLPSTPIIFILFIFVAVCVWAARKGPQNLMKYSILFSAICILIIVVNGLLLVTLFDLKNFMPTLTLPVSNYLVSVHSLTVIPLCDPIVLLMFLPDMQNPNEFGKALYKGLIIGTIILLFVVVRDIAVLGQTTEVFSFPSFSTIRMIDIGDILTRMDIIYIAVLTSLMFYKVSILFYASVSGIQRIFKFSSYKFMLSILGVLMIIYSTLVFPSSGEHSKWLNSGAAEVYNTFFVILLPVLTLVVAICRGYFKQPKTAQ